MTGGNRVAQGMWEEALQPTRRTKGLTREQDTGFRTTARELFAPRSAFPSPEPSYPFLDQTFHKTVLDPTPLGTVAWTLSQKLYKGLHGTLPPIASHIRGMAKIITVVSLRVPQAILGPMQGCFIMRLFITIL